MNDKKGKKQEEVPNEEVSQLKQEVEDCKSKYLRALADYQNLERRVGLGNIALRIETEAQLLLKLLPFLDNVEKAEVFIKDPGLKLIKDQFAQVLHQMGLKEIEVLGKEYNPHFAEAIEAVPGEKDNIVVEVVQKGYEYKGKLLRSATVKVSKQVKN